MQIEEQQAMLYGKLASITIEQSQYALLLHCLTYTLAIKKNDCLSLTGYSPDVKRVYDRSGYQKMYQDIDDLKSLIRMVQDSVRNVD